MTRGNPRSAASLKRPFHGEKSPSSRFCTKNFYASVCPLLCFRRHVKPLFARLRIQSGGWQEQREQEKVVGVRWHQGTMHWACLEVVMTRTLTSRVSKLCTVFVDVLECYWACLVVDKTVLRLSRSSTGGLTSWNPTHPPLRAVQEGA